MRDDWRAARGLWWGKGDANDTGGPNKRAPGERQELGQAYALITALMVVSSQHTHTHFELGITVAAAALGGVE